MNIMEEIFVIRSCIEIWATDIKIYAIYRCMFSLDGHGTTLTASTWPNTVLSAVVKWLRIEH